MNLRVGDDVIGIVKTLKKLFHHGIQKTTLAPVMNKPSLHRYSPLPK